MARTKQTARASTGGKAPRKQLAAEASRHLRAFLTSQQRTGTTMRGGVAVDKPTSFINCENVIGSFGFAAEPTEEVFAPRFSLAKVAAPQTGVEEVWIGLQWASKFDGGGLAKHGRPSLSLVLVVDISGSMRHALEGDDEQTTSKLEVAKRCVRCILSQLSASDQVGVLLFNHGTHLLQPMGACTNPFKKNLMRKLNAIRAGGGTVLERGLSAGMEVLSVAEPRELQRVYFLTDMLSGANDEAAMLEQAERYAALSQHTTVVGVGVDLSVGTVERLAAIPGGKYMSVMNSKEFDGCVGSDFGHDVLPIAFNIKLALTGGFSIERACGSAEINHLLPGATTVNISSEFASPLDKDLMSKGGLILFKLRTNDVRDNKTSNPDGKALKREGELRAKDAPHILKRVTRAQVRTGTATQEGDSQAADESRSKNSAGVLHIQTSWESARGRRFALTTDLTVPRRASPPASSALRKGLALVRFVDLQNDFCEFGKSEQLPARLDRLERYREGRESLLAEMRAVGDNSMGTGADNEGLQADEATPNANFLQTLDQIIAIETRETDEIRKAATELHRETSPESNGKRSRCDERTIRACRTRRH